MTRTAAMLIACSMAASPCSAQSTDVGERSTVADRQVNVNWLYGSYVPRDVPLEPLEGGQRLSLYIRQTYTTWGIYIKTTMFAAYDQIHESDPEWGKGADAFTKRFGTRQAQFIVQNSVASLGTGLLRWEPRYDRCRCDGFWPRTRHAIARNFVTYARDERSRRPHVMPYVGAFAGGAIAATWRPGHVRWHTAGYEAAVAQVLIGIGVNWIGEFAPEIVEKLRRKPHASAAPAQQIER